MTLATGSSGKPKEGNQMKDQTVEQLNAQLDRYGAWMRKSGRRNIEKARSVSQSMQQIRDELAKR